jgi:serine/threonine-protein kinase
MRWHRGDTALTPLVATPAFEEVAPGLSPDGRWLAYGSNESGRYEVYVRPYPDVNAGRWQVSQNGGAQPLWSHSGRELYYRNGAGALVAATVVPGSSFALGAQAVLFDVSRFLNISAFTLYYDVAPDDKRFLFLRVPGSATRTGTVNLVQVTNWSSEVQASATAQAVKK